MKWGELKLATMQTIFANEGPNLSEDDSNQDYLQMMPAKTNEALQQACVVRPLVKKWTVTVSADAQQETVEPGVSVTLPVQQGLYHLDMTVLVPRFRAIHDGEVMLDSGGVYGYAEEWQIEGDTTLVIPGETVGEYTVFYRAYPQTIDATTEDSVEIDVPAEVAHLLPLYIASELYKDDDLAMATMWRNEWEDGLEKVRQAYDESADGAFRAEMRHSTTGWW